jgi:glycine betaine/proline transport system substrate-binding protein
MFVKRGKKRDLKKLRPFRLVQWLGVLALLGLSGSAHAAGKAANLAYVEWAGAVASVHVVKAALEQRMGYSVTIAAMEAKAVWDQTAGGEIDGFTCAWLPTTHRHYYEKTKNDVVNLGHNLVGTRIGLVVPAYVPVDAIGELNAYAEEFDHKIIGIDPNAGIMEKTAEAMQKYRLDALQLVEGSGAMMASVLAEKIRSRDWVVATGWTPHWIFRRWDLKYLADPEGIYGGEEYIDTIARKNLKADDPDLYALLDNFKWQLEDIHEVMYMNAETDALPHENAVEWIHANEAKVAAWLPAEYR